MPKVVHSNDARYREVEARAHVGRRPLRFAFFTGASFAVIVLALGGLSALSGSYLLGQSLKDGTLNALAAVSVAFELCSSVLDIVVSVLVLRFYIRVYRGGLQQCFSSSKEMRAIAICLLINVIVKLISPKLPTMYLFSGVIELESSGPSLDLLSLFMSGFFFVLSSIFQYGAAVQNDSDEIV